MAALTSPLVSDVATSIPTSEAQPSGWWVYMIETRSGKFYTGVTTDVQRRFDEHSNPASARGAKFFRTDPAKKVVYREPAANRSAACRREAAIKKLSRPKKCQLVAAGLGLGD